MKKMKKFLFIGAAVAFLTSCTTVYPVTATNNAIGGKVGTSETSMLFYFHKDVDVNYQVRGVGPIISTLSGGIVFNNDFGVIEAAEKGGLSKVATVDIEITNYFIFRKA